MPNENSPVMSQTLSPSSPRERPPQSAASSQAAGVQSGAGGKNRAALLRPARIGLFYLALFGLWWIVAARHIWPPYLLPSPVDVGLFLRDSLKDGTLLPAIATSATRVFAGYGIALVGGTVLGVALARSRMLDETVGSAVVGLQSLPSICWFPLALIWFGLNEKAVLFVIVMGSLFAIALAVKAGVRQIPPLTLRAARMLGAGSGPRLWRHVLLPAILPAFLSGMRQGWAFAWRSLMSAELLSQSLRIGVGHLLNNGRDLNDMSMVLGMIFVILALGLFVDRVLFFPIERAVSRRWGVEGA